MAIQRVAVVGGGRTPFAKAPGVLKTLDAVTLTQHALDAAIAHTGVDPMLVEAVHVGTTVVSPRVPHLAREATLKSTLGPQTRSLTYTDNCIGGTSAIAGLHDAIALGRVNIGLAGGVESMSNTTIMVSENASEVLRDASMERTITGKLGHFTRLRAADLAPQIPGVEEPSTGLTMGQHCELMVKEWGITREAQDALAFRSHQTAAAAVDEDFFANQVAPIGGLEHDGIIRRTTSLEKLATLKPVFDRSKAGTLTAGNSSALTDGAAAVMLMSETAAEQQGVSPLAFIAGFHTVGIDPGDGLLMGPGVAVPQLLQRLGMKASDIDLWEIHEAFAGQVLCNIAAWEKGWKEPAIGTIDMDRVNVYGGSLAIGHPFAATGGRIVLGLAHALRRRKAKVGLLSICAAGAQAAAMVLVNPDA